jgi:hypothetical protein
MVMGLLLSPATAKLFMKNYDKGALSGAAYKPHCQFQYVDDTHL